MKTLSTVAEVTAAKAPGLHPIGNAVGLLLQVNKDGAKSWVFRYRLNNTRRVMGLGSAARVTLAEARRAATAAATLRDQGIDPIEDRRTKRKSLKVQATRVVVWTFRDFAEQYIRTREKGWKRPDAGYLWRHPFEKWIYPVIGDHDIATLTLPDIVDSLKEAWYRVPETARRMRARIEMIITAAIADGLFDRPNPAVKGLVAIKLPYAKRTIRHYPAAELDDAPTLFQRIHEGQGTPFRALEFMILTTVRPSEARCARWSEIDLSKGLLTIPAERMKAHKAHIVPLVPAAVAILEQQAQVRVGDYIFPGLRPDAPLSYNPFAKALHKIGIKGITPHSWRSVFRDACGDLFVGVPRDLAEAQLAHSLGDTEAAYRRKSAVEKRRVILLKYSAWLSGETGDNVVQFPASPAAA